MAPESDERSPISLEGRWHQPVTFLLPISFEELYQEFSRRWRQEFADRKEGDREGEQQK